MGKELGVPTSGSSDTRNGNPVSTGGGTGGQTADPIRENYWVEVAGQDSDESGENDRVHVEIARPASTAGTDTQLPVVVEPSPYYGGFNSAQTNETRVELYTPDDGSGTVAGGSGETIELDEGDLVEFTGTSDPQIGPSEYEQEFLDKGYVWAYAASVGTEQSTGCLDTGGDREVNGLEAVVDWLNGRADAYDAQSGGNTVDATWTNGRTGMIGASYNGTLPNAVASRGVDGIETIIPHVAISSWYSYYRMNGHVIAPNENPEQGFTNGADTDWLQKLVLADQEECAHVTQELSEGQDRLTGDYNDYWRERDYVTDANAVDASVLLTHGLSDHNVKLRNAWRWLDTLADNGVPYKVWLHQGGHEDPIGRSNRSQWLDLLGDWLAYWLKDADNGVMDRPTAWVQRGGNSGPLATYGDWPAPGASGVPIEFSAGGETVGGLGLDSDASGVTETLRDNSSRTNAASVFTYADETASDNRLRYETDPLEESLHLSGTLRPRLRLSFDREAAIVSVALVDYAPDDSFEIVNWGWADPQNRNTLDDSDPIQTGTFYDIEFPTQPVDHVFEAGHRLGLVVYSTDVHFTLLPVDDDRRLTLSVGESAVELPVVGGQEALASALGEAVTVTAGDVTMTAGGSVDLSIDATNTSTVEVGDLWTDWTVTGSQLDGGTPTDAVASEGRYEVSWPDDQSAVTLQLTIEPGDRYVGGRYGLGVTASAADGRAESGSPVLQIQSQ